MQIDFHHAITYLVACAAGMKPEDAEKVAYAAQYVDNAVERRPICFQGGFMFSKEVSAHKIKDERNLWSVNNMKAWMPFHFLPGNGGLEAGKSPDGSAVNMLICRPNSPIAKDMMKSTLQDKDKPYGLIRLGVALHVFADTYAHQGFVGKRHKVNLVKNLKDRDPDGKTFVAKTKIKLFDWFDRVKSNVINHFPLGHGAALTFPDSPWLVWNYIDWAGKELPMRDNTQEFVNAADEMCKWVKRYLANDSAKDVQGLTDEQKEFLLNHFKNIIDIDEGNRHKKWLELISSGKCAMFKCPCHEITYKAFGKGSWKHAATGSEKEVDKDELEFAPSFLESDWKYFHDALLVHHFNLTRKIFPKYGICAP